MSRGVATDDWRAWADRDQAWLGVEREVRRDALKHMLAELPDPVDFARYLPLHLAEALCGAVNRGDLGQIVGETHAAELRSLGLVGFGRNEQGRGVSAFGWAVRRALMAEDA